MYSCIICRERYNGQHKLVIDISLHPGIYTHVDCSEVVGHRLVFLQLSHQPGLQPPLCKVHHILLGNT